MMDDNISRQAAIDALAKWLYGVFGIKESDGTATIFKRFRELPSVQPERKKGKWMRIGNTELANCECGFITDRYSMYNYCPICGADNRGEQDG